MASTVIQPVADAIGSVLTAMGVTVKAYVWAPATLDATPAGVVQLPEVARTQPDSMESQFGSDDWRMVYPVVLYFDLDEAFTAQTTAAEYVEKFIAAVDADRGLSGTVIDATVTHATPSYPTADEPRPLLQFECEVSVLKFVAST